MNGKTSKVFSMIKGHWRTIALILLAAFAASIIGWGIIFQPNCDDVLNEIQNEKTESEGTYYSGSVTCERDCQVSFGHSKNSDHGSNSENSKTNPTCNTVTRLDLVEQKRMSHWAKISAILAMLGFFGILWTFRESHRMGQIQTRAYISVAGGYVRFNVRHFTYFEFVITVHNTGKSPAFEISIEGTSKLQTAANHSPETLISSELNNLTIHEIGGDERIERTARIHGDLLAAVAQFNKGTAIFSFYGTMRYTDVYDAPHRRKFAVTAEGGPVEADANGWIKFPLIRIHPKIFDEHFQSDD